MSKRSRWKKLKRLEEAQREAQGLPKGVHEGTSGEGVKPEHTEDAHVIRSEREESHKHEEKKSSRLYDKRYTGLKGIYFNKYRILIFIPFIILFLAVAQIAFQAATTGDFLHKGVSLKGGVTITITSEQAAATDSVELQKILSERFSQLDIDVKKLKAGGKNIGIIVEADILQDDEQKLNSFLSTLEEQTLTERESFSMEMMGSSLGASFFRETFIAVLIAFLFMGIVVFIYFRTFIPSIAVILAAFSDIIVTLAVINVLGIKLSTAGIAAFLMLIGYSVDTDILLSTHLLKRKEGTLNERLSMAIKTGLTMSITTIAAITVALFVSESEVLRQIMIVLLIGLIVDLVNTWLQNVGILKIYLEKKWEG